MATIASTFMIEDKSRGVFSKILKNIDAVEKKLKKLTVVSTFVIEDKSYSAFSNILKNINAVEKKLKKLTVNKKTGKLIDGEFSHYYHELNKVISDYSKEVKNLQKQFLSGDIKIDELEGSFKDLNKSIRENFDEIVKLDDIYDLLNNKHTVTANRLNSLRTSVSSIINEEEQFISTQKKLDEALYDEKPISRFEKLKNVMLKISKVAGVVVASVVTIGKKLIGVFNKIFKQFKISLSQLFSYAKSLFSKIKDMIDETSDLYVQQMSIEQRLASTLKHRFSASESEVRNMFDLAKRLSEEGIYSDKFIMKGLDRLSLYANSVDDLLLLGEGFVNLIATRQGLDATESNMISTVDAIGRAFKGNFQNISRQTGIVLNDMEKKFVETANSADRVHFLLKKINNVAGDMNRILGENKTSEVQKLANKLEDMKESVGQFTYRIKRVFEYIKNSILMKVYEKVEDLFEYIKNNADEVIKKLKAFAGTLVTIAGVIAGAFMVANAPLLLMIGTVMDLTDTWSKMKDGGESAIRGVLNSLDVAITKIYNGIVWLINRIYNALISNKVVQKFLGFEVKQAGSFGNYVVDGFYKDLNNKDVAYGDEIKSKRYKQLYYIGANYYKKQDEYYNPNVYYYKSEEYAKKVSDFASDYAKRFLKGLYNYQAGGGDLNKYFSEEDYNTLMSLYENDVLKPAFEKLDENQLLAYKDASGKTQYYGVDLGLKEIENPHIFSNSFDKISSGIDKYFPMLLEGMTSIYSIDGDVETIKNNVINLSNDWRDMLTKRAQERFNLHYRNLTPTVTVNVEANNQNFDAFNLSNIITKEISDVVSKISGSSLTGVTSAGQAVSPIGGRVVI